MRRSGRGQHGDEDHHDDAHGDRHGGNAQLIRERDDNRQQNDGHCGVVREVSDDQGHREHDSDEAHL